MRVCGEERVHGGGGDYSEDEQLDDPDEVQVCACVGRRGFMGVDVLRILFPCSPPISLA